MGFKERRRAKDLLVSDLKEGNLNSKDHYSDDERNN